jgi:hypothetical protein
MTNPKTTLALSHLGRAFVAAQKLRIGRTCCCCANQKGQNESGTEEKVFHAELPPNNEMPKQGALRCKLNGRHWESDA